MRKLLTHFTQALQVPKPSIWRLVAQRPQLTTYTEAIQENTLIVRFSEQGFRTKLAIPGNSSNNGKDNSTCFYLGMGIVLHFISFHITPVRISDLGSLPSLLVLAVILAFPSETRSAFSAQSHYPFLVVFARLSLDLPILALVVPLMLLPL